jgi:hypothetical protein
MQHPYLIMQRADYALPGALSYLLLSSVKGHFIPQYWGQIIPHPLVA